MSSEISICSDSSSEFSITFPRQFFQSDVNKISKQFLPLIASLRFFGPYPILLECDKRVIFWKRSPAKENKAKDGDLYEFCWNNWKSPIIICAYLLTTFNIFCWTIFIFNKGLGIHFPVDLMQAPEIYKTPNEVGINSVTNRIAMIAEGAIKLMETLIIFYNSKSFVTWINNWNTFEENFASHFSHKSIEFDFNIKCFQRLIITFYFLIPAIFWICLDTYVMLPECQTTPNYCLVFAYVLWVNVLLMGHTLLEDYKTLLMLKTLQVAFCQIRVAVGKDFRSHIITPADVIAWRQLIHQIRTQVHLCSDHFKCRHLVLLLESVLIFSIGILLAEDYIVNEKNIFYQQCFLVSVVSLCIISYIRMYSMTLMTEKMYGEEELLTNYIIEMQMSYLDVPTKVELKFTYLMLVQRPSVITLGNYVKVNKKMLLRVVFQVLTFTIAMMQFNNSLRHDASYTNKNLQMKSN